MDNIEKIIYETGGVKKTKKNKTLVTRITSESDKDYYLYSDGNLYEKNDIGELVVLDKLNPNSKQIIDKIMQKYKSIRKIDIVSYDEKDCK